MQATPNILTDLVFVKPGNYNRLDNFFIRFIRDERDLPFIYFTISIILFLVPYAVLLSLLGKRYDLLAKNFVNIGNRFTSEEAVVAFLKERTTRFTHY